MAEMLEVMLEGNCALISIEGHVLMDENANLSIIAHSAISSGMALTIVARL